MHIKSGHTVHTANQGYGVSEVNMRRLDSASLEVYRRPSRVAKPTWIIERGLGFRERQTLQKSSTYGPHYIYHHQQ